MSGDAVIAVVAGAFFFVLQSPMRWLRNDPHAFRNSAAAAAAFATAWFVATDLLPGSNARIVLILILIMAAVLAATSRYWLPRVRRLRS